MTEEYKSVISSRPAFNRVISTSMINLSSEMPSGTVFMHVTKEYGSEMSTGYPMGRFSQQIRDNREREKMEMRQLNDKLANFIEKVRFLDAQNRMMTSEVDHINNCLSKEKSSKKLCEIEINGAENVIKEGKEAQEVAGKNVDSLKEQLRTMRENFDEANKGHDADREKIEELLIELSNLEAEINLLKRRIALLEEEVAKKKKENLRLTNLLQSTRVMKDQQALQSLQFRNQVSSLVEEIQFTTKDREEELADLLALAARDTTNENREYFKNELSNAIKEIRNDYEEMNNSHRQEMESSYSMTIQEIETQRARQNVEDGHQKSETKKMKTQIGELRNRLVQLEGRNAQLEKQIQESNFQIEDDQRMYESELTEMDRKIKNENGSYDSLMIEYQMMMDKKQSLDAELAIYRKMLEGEEEGPGLKQLIEQVVRTTGITEVADTETMRVVKGETSSRSSHSKSAKGNVAIKEVCPEAHFVIVENTHRSKDEQIGGWKLKRKIDGKREIVFAFPEEFLLAAASTVTIFALGRGQENHPHSLVFADGDCFGQGSSVQTVLYNGQGEERASLMQREVASSSQVVE